METDDGDLYLGGSSGGGYPLLVELLTLADNLDVACKSKRGVQDNSKDFGPSKSNDGVVIY